MAHNTVKLNGVIDPNSSIGAPTYIPGEYSPTPLFDITEYYPSGGFDIFLVDCLYTIHDTAASLSEATYITRYVITYQIHGGNVYWNSQQQLFEFNDCNGAYTPPNHLFLANTWSDGLVLIPDPMTPWNTIGRVMYDINIIIR
jgi:hypothetical protein